RIALAYNGNITNVSILREKLKNKKVHLKGSSDAEILAYELLYELIMTDCNLVNSVQRLMQKIDGAYSVVGLIDDGTLFAFKDPHGIRPLVYGFDKEKGIIIIASESVALDVNGIPYGGSVEPGELLIVKNEKIVHYKLGNFNEEAFCAFEYAYFARPDSKLDDELYVYEARRNLGRKLAKRYLSLASRIDVIIPVPETAIDAAYGFHEEINKPVEPIIIRHRYVRQRAFIMSADERSYIISKKYNILADKVRNKSVALIDDSIVRGDTLKYIAEILRRIGVKEIHVFSTFPKIVSPCFYGIDMATFHELIGFNRNEKQIARILNVDSVNYQTINDFCEAVKNKKLCFACVTGNYPTQYAQKLADNARHKTLEGLTLNGRITEVTCK
ncbi:MAG: amidophosphoribosyltransferase, partial [Thermoprotei archaeon]